MAVYQINHQQELNASLDEVWNFISRPENLSKITPDSMGFEIETNPMPEKMYAGMIIKYKVRPLLGIKTTWVTEITQIKEQKYFVDEQRVGPYKMWHHEHILVQTEKGVLMKDIITYQPPFGFLGRIANKLIISRKLKGIFEYRRKVLDAFFNPT